MSRSSPEANLQSNDLLSTPAAFSVVALPVVSESDFVSRHASEIDAVNKVIGAHCADP
jgi:hypothetical protein